MNMKYAKGWICVCVKRPRGTVGAAMKFSLLVFMIGSFAILSYLSVACETIAKNGK